MNALSSSNAEALQIGSVPPNTVLRSFYRHSFHRTQTQNRVRTIGAYQTIQSRMSATASHIQPSMAYCPWEAITRAKKDCF